MLWIGKNNITTQAAQTPEQIAAWTDVVVEWLAPVAKRIVVLGEFVNGSNGAGVPSPTEIGRVHAVNAIKSAVYGPVYVDVQAWLMSDEPWDYLRWTPTSEDLTAIAAGTLPPSLWRSAEDRIHLHNDVYTALVQTKVRDILENHYEYGA